MPTFEDRALVTIHGAMSDSEGLNALCNYCRERLPGLNTFHVNYHEIGVRRIINDDPIRHLIQETVQAQFLTLLSTIEAGRGYPARLATKILVVAHSYGTVVLYEYLRAAHLRLVLERVVLTGCILQRWINWTYFIETSRILRHPPINFVRPFDCIARLGRRMTHERSMSGTRGFSEIGAHVPMNVFKPGGHRAYNPDDFDDIVAIINGTFTGARYSKEERAFLATLSLGERAKLRLYRALRWA
jgi:hypothetical protein